METCYTFTPLYHLSILFLLFLIIKPPEIKAFDLCIANSPLFWIYHIFPLQHYLFSYTLYHVTHSMHSKFHLLQPPISGYFSFLCLSKLWYSGQGWDFTRASLKCSPWVFWLCTPLFTLRIHFIPPPHFLCSFSATTLSTNQSSHHIVTSHNTSSEVFILFLVLSFVLWVTRQPH